MKNKDLIFELKTLEKDLLSNADINDFFKGVDLESENDLTNQFLLKYISLKSECFKRMLTLNYSLKDKTIIVTGGSSGIGEQVAKLCKQLGAKIYVFDIKKPNIENVVWFNVDVTDKNQVDNAVNSIQNIDYLVTCAGLFGFDESMTKEQRDREFNVNVNGTINLVEACFEKLKKSSGGICSITSGLCKTLDPTCLTYCITKQEIMKYVTSKKNLGVKINTVLPGPILTPLLVKDVPTLVELAEYASLNPEGYCGCPEHIALGVVDLIATNQNNVDLALDGGESKMYKKEDNKYWIKNYNGGFSIEYQGKTYEWDLDNSYIGVENETDI